MRDLIEAGLARSRKIIATGHELVPRFRIAAADGETLIFVQLPDNLEERARRMSLVSAYMAVHMARSFVMASELQEPASLSAVAVTRQGCEAGLQIGDDLPAMLPDKVAAVTREQIAEVDHLLAHDEGIRIAAV